MTYMKFGENLKTHKMSLIFFSTKDFPRCLNFTHVLKCHYNITDIIRLSHLETEIFTQLVCRRYASRKTRRMNLSGLILWIPVLYIDSPWLIPAWGQRMTVTKDIGPSFGSCINITMKKIFTRISLLLVQLKHFLVYKNNWKIFSYNYVEFYCRVSKRCKCSAMIFLSPISNSVNLKMYIYQC